MTRIAFCDDDAALLHQMQDFLEQYRTLRGVQLELAPYTKPMELLADIETGVRFDVLFLDVLMPGINGINAAREIRRYDTAVQIIFVTSSSEFAVQSYVVGAYYYQLKPIWKDSFFRLTDAVLAECRKRTQHSLILRCKNGVTRITLDSLEYCEVQGRSRWQSCCSPCRCCCCSSGSLPPPCGSFPTTRPRCSASSASCRW